MSKNHLSQVQKMVAFNYLDIRGNHILRVVSLEGDPAKIPYFLGMDACRILDLHPVALVVAGKGTSTRVRSADMGLSLSSNAAMVLDKDGLFRLIAKAYEKSGNSLACPFEMWMRTKILPQLEPGQKDDEYDPDIEDDLFDDDEEEEQEAIFETTALALPESMDAMKLGDAQYIEKKPQVFEHPAFGNLRVVVDEKTGEPWFVAKDVAVILGYVNPQKAVREHCKRVNKTVTPTNQGLQTVSIITEPDVYRLIIRSKLPAAEQFEEWVMEDVHTLNQKAAGLATRDDAKTFIYAFLYGAGPELLGAFIVPDGTPKQKKAAGLKLTARFLARTPAIKKLKEAISNALSTRRYLKGMDGRLLRVRSKHSALNLLFQSAGALLVKLATVLWHERLAAEGLVHGRDYKQVVHVHDEVQAHCKPEYAELVGRAFVEAIEAAGKHFAFRVPMTGEYKIGKNWKETH